VVIRLESLSQQIEAIRSLAVRGAPAIGVFGAFSLALAIARGEDPETCHGELLKSRPTAVDLRNCLDEVMESFEEGGPEAAIARAEYLKVRTIESCKLIGMNGEELIPDNGKVMTHCNAGALATLDWGTALAPIRMKARHGGDPFVWVSETRPLLQGARLTSWELQNEGIDHMVFVDSASGQLLSSENVDLVIVGADRVARNGDIANKIGTLEKAVLCREFGIPFYVAFPETTFDPLCGDGSSIPIEQRSRLELEFAGERRMVPDDARIHNPAFDVTPAKYISGYVTESGILKANELK
jgi:translation initiation factor eIF-2B subunit alpha/methylthioribose-1-phosphate isomerase